MFFLTHIYPLAGTFKTLQFKAQGHEIPVLHLSPAGATFSLEFIFSLFRKTRLFVVRPAIIFI